MSDIEKVRTILAEVRNGASSGTWRRFAEGTVFSESGYLVAENVDDTDASLIVLMTNPALLDAIDGMLEATKFVLAADRMAYTSANVAAAERIASTIVTGWEAMQR